MEQAFDLDSFIANINNDRTKPRSAKDKLNCLTMNSFDNQGTLTFIPCFSKEANSYYLKIDKVYEYFGDTSLNDYYEDGVWFRVLPIEYYGNLSEEDIDLYNEVKGYLDLLNYNEAVDYQEFRIRNYSLLFGILLKLKNKQDKEITDYVDCPCLFCYPSPAPINQICDAINTKIDTLNGRRDWLSRVMSQGNTGRRGVLQLKFVSGSDKRYDCTASFEMNNADEGITVIDPEYTISDEILSKFDSILPTFLKWQYDRDNKSLFNRIAFKELRDQLKLRIKELNGSDEPAPESVPENKNDLTPKPADQSAVKRPF